jgi:putative spermidine/putrescine transport system permease protein
VSRRGRLALPAGVALIAVFLVAPTVIMAIMSLSPSTGLQFPPPGLSTRWYRTFLASPMWVSATLTSLQVAAATAALATVLGTLAALGLVRGRFPGRGLVNALVMSPLIVPTVVTAIGMYFVFVRWRLAGSFLGLVLAHTVLCLPFVVVNVASGLQNLDQSLELAARSLGARPGQVFRRVTLPLILPGVVAGALIAFAFSWDEVVVAIFLSTPITRTLPAVMWGEVQTRIDPTSAAVATMISLVTFVIVPVWLLVQRAASRDRLRAGGAAGA